MTTLAMVDKNATPETRALQANLWLIQQSGFMFGHHDDLWYGRKWYNVPGRSDTREVCGDYPAVFSFDVAEIMDDRHAAPENAIRRRVAIEAYTQMIELIGDKDPTTRRLLVDVLMEEEEHADELSDWLTRS